MIPQKKDHGANEFPGIVVPTLFTFLENFKMALLYLLDQNNIAQRESEKYKFLDSFFEIGINLKNCKRGSLPFALSEAFKQKIERGVKERLEEVGNFSSSFVCGGHPNGHRFSRCKFSWNSVDRNGKISSQQRDVKPNGPWADLLNSKALTLEADTYSNYNASYAIERDVSGSYRVCRETYSPGVFTMCLKGENGRPITWQSLNFDPSAFNPEIPPLTNEERQAFYSPNFEINNRLDIRALFILQCCNCLLSCYNPGMLKYCSPSSSGFRIEKILSFRGKIRCGNRFTEKDWDEVCGCDFTPFIEAFSVGLLFGGSFSGLARLSGRLVEIIRISRADLIDNFRNYYESFKYSISEIQGPESLLAKDELYLEQEEKRLRETFEW